MTNIIKNNTDGYGYKYASLKDMVEQGAILPKIKTGTDPLNMKDYLYYWDADLNEWCRGAEIVVPEIKGQNIAQRYKSAITIGRRTTTEMALGLACTDDELIEATDENGEMKKPRKVTDKQIEYLTKLYTQDELKQITEYYQVANITDLSMDIVSQYISSRKAKNDEKKHNTQR